MLTTDRQRAFRGFGALSTYQLARADAVVAKAKASADEAAALVPGVVSTLWSSLIGADSSAAALQTNATAAQNLYETLLAKRNRLAADPNAGEDDVLAMESSQDAFDNAAGKEASTLLTPTGAIVETAKGTAADIAGAVSNPFGIPLWAWVAGAGALAIFVLLPRRRS